MANTALDNSHQSIDAQMNGLLKARLPGNREDLISAFELFNNMSAQLADTYRDMEQQVGSLNAELHRVAEQRLQELKEKECVTQRLEGLLNLLPAGVVVLDSNGIVSQCNPAAVDLLGEPLLGCLWRDIIQRSFSPQLDDGHEISLQDGRRISMLTRSLQGEPGQLILLNDLTETRNLQKRVDRHRRLSEMGRMVSSLAHQIRTPLSAAMLYAGHLCDSALTQEQYRRFSQKVLSRLTHLEQQVKDMLTFVKGDVKLTDTVTIAELFTQLEAAMEVSVQSSDSHYQLHNTIPQLALQCNRDSMIGAIVNLVNNAIEAVGRQAQLIISAEQINSQQLSITVQDTGPGIAKDVLDDLQDPFFTTKTQGTGLGLSVVKAVARAHHGEFNLISEPGQGTSAQILLPIMEQHTQQ